MTEPIADEQAPAIIEQSQAVSFAIPLEEFRANLDAIKHVVHEYLSEGEDWGKIPGTQKPTLLKPGAEKLCDLYGFAQTFEVTHRIEDWTRASLVPDAPPFPFIHYEVRCDLLRRSDGRLVSSGVGACSSMEAKYRWRNDKLACPACGMELRRSKQAEEFYCWAAKGGCGAKYPLSIAADKPLGKIENVDIADQVNTILKMASKRALIDATLHATRSSGLLTQDIEDFPTADPGFETTPAEEMDGVEQDTLPNCPTCGMELRKSETEFYCWKKKGGCGAQWPLTYFDKGDTPFEGSYHEIDDDLPQPQPAPAASPAENGATRPMTEKQREYLFTGGKAGLDTALAVRWLIQVGGLKGAQAALKDNSMPPEISECVRYNEAGVLSWSKDITEAQASALITKLKEVLGVGSKSDPAAMLKAFWAMMNKLGIAKDDVHKFFGIPLDDGALKDLVVVKAKYLKTTQSAIWSMLRSQVEQAHEAGTLHRGEEGAVADDIAFE